jgi:hypothetical protein
LAENRSVVKNLNLGQKNLRDSSLPNRPDWRAANHPPE